MQSDLIHLNFLSLFSLMCFFVFLVIQKYSSKIGSGILLDKDFDKPQSFHKSFVSRSGGLASFICLIIFFYFKQKKGRAKLDLSQQGGKLEEYSSSFLKISFLIKFSTDFGAYSTCIKCIAHFFWLFLNATTSSTTKSLKAVTLLECRNSSG